MQGRFDERGGGGPGRGGREGEPRSSMDDDQGGDDDGFRAPEGPIDDPRWEAAQDGAELLTEGFVDEAIDELTQRYEDDPDNEHVLLFLGKAYGRKGDLPRALKAFLEAIARAPDFLGAFVEAGRVLQRMGRPGHAMRMAKEILARRPDDSDALWLAGTSFFQTGDYEEARPYLEAFLAGPHEVVAGLDARTMLELIGRQEQRQEDEARQAMLRELDGVDLADLTAPLIRGPTADDASPEPPSGGAEDDAGGKGPSS